MELLQVQHSTSLAPSRHRAAQPKASLRQKPSLPRDEKTALHHLKPEWNSPTKETKILNCLVFSFLGWVGGNSTFPKRRSLLEGRAKKLPESLTRWRCCEKWRITTPTSNVHLPLRSLPTPLPSSSEMLECKLRLRHSTATQRSWKRALHGHMASPSFPRLQCGGQAALSWCVLDVKNLSFLTCYKYHQKDSALHIVVCSHVPLIAFFSF